MYRLVYTMYNIVYSMFNLLTLELKLTLVVSIVFVTLHVIMRYVTNTRVY